MQSASSRIWTRVAVSISYDDNHYTTGTSHRLDPYQVLPQSGAGSDVNKGILRIPQNFSITGTSPSDCLVSYPGHSLRKSYPSAEKQSVHSTALADWTNIFVERGLN